MAKASIKTLLLEAFPECPSQEQAIHALKQWGDVSKGTWYRWLNGETEMPLIARRALELKAETEQRKAKAE